MPEAKFEDLKGKIIRQIDVHQDELDKDDYIIFEISKDEIYKMYHEQDCCESVSIEDICGSIESLLDTEILVAEERSQECENEKDEYPESITWTFYEIVTIKGSVTIRWYGTSNGYYSESVSFDKME